MARQVRGLTNSGVLVTGFYAEYYDIQDTKHCLILVSCDEHGNFAQFEVDEFSIEDIQY